MARLVKIKNPFDPWNGKEIEVLNLEKGTTIEQLLANTKMPYSDVQVTVNAKTISTTALTVCENDFIVFSPRVQGNNGKMILGMVAMMALAVATFGSGAAGSAGLYGHLTADLGWGAFTAGLACSAVMVVGGYLINRMFGSKIDTGNYDSGTNNSTYSWSGVQTMEGQNNSIALTYGTVKSAGQSISKFIDIDGDDEYLSWLIAAGEGPLTITDIKLNDTTIDYYEDVEYDIREGTNDQSIIPNFNDTYATKSLAYELADNSPRIETVPGNASEGIKVKLECGSGLYHINDDGGVEGASINLTIEYRLASASTWTKMGDYTISASQTSAVRKEYRVDNLTAGAYEVRVTITGRSHTLSDSRACVKISWSEVTAIVYDDFSYPNIALIGLHAKATDQLSGSPNISFIKSRDYVWVWVPEDNAYEQMSANNPAWASYDMLHQCSRLKNINTSSYEYEVRGVPAKYMMYERFKEWADFCTTKDLKVNIELNSLGEMLETVNANIAPIGRGRVVRFGTRYGCIWDCTREPVQMFGMGNIIAGSFKEEFLELSERSNCVELTYTDADHDYSRETVTIYGTNYDTDAEEKTSQITYDGITNYAQAYREGMYQLYSNEWLLRTISFEASVDAIACTIGDVVMVAHDVPKWAKSGRIAQVNGQELLLPVELDSTSGTFRVMYRTANDNIYSSNVTILSNSNGWCRVNVATAFSATDPPQVNDIFDLALATVGSKPFVVKNITRAQDFTRTIECIEYNEKLYNEDYGIPVIEYADDKDPLTEVAKLNGTLYNGNLDISWERTCSGSYLVYASIDGEDFELIGSTSKTRYTLETDKAYTHVKVVTARNGRRTKGAVAELNQLDIDDGLNLLLTYGYYGIFDDYGDDQTIRYDYWKCFAPYIPASKISSSGKVSADDVEQIIYLDDYLGAVTGSPPSVEAYFSNYGDITTGAIWSKTYNPKASDYGLSVAQSAVKPFFDTSKYDFVSYTCDVAIGYKSATAEGDPTFVVQSTAEVKITDLYVLFELATTGWITKEELYRYATGDVNWPSDTYNEMIIRVRDDNNLTYWSNGVTYKDAYGTHYNAASYAAGEVVLGTLQDADDEDLTYSCVMECAVTHSTEQGKTFADYYAAGYWKPTYNKAVVSSTIKVRKK